MPTKSSSRRLHVSLIAAVLIAAAACTDSTTPTPTPSATGLWDFSTTVVLSPPGITCADTGSLALTQQDTAVTGEVEFLRTCVFPGPPGIGTSHEHYAVAGTLHDRILIVEFRGLTGSGVFCTDTLTLGSGNATIGGLGACGFQRITLAGHVGDPIASASMHPDTLTLVTGAGATLSADFRTAAGWRAYLRPVVWTVANASVASVSSTGVVTALGAGASAITATAGGHAASATLTVPAPTGLTHVGAGNARTCALASTGDAFCWGVPVVGTPGGPIPKLIAGGLHFIDLAVGADHACGRTAANAVWCWGAGSNGQLGTGLAADAITPQQVLGGPVLVSLTAGGAHTCGLTALGAAWCWGADSLGQLGRNGNGMSSVPVAVSGGLTFAALSAGPRHTCGIATGGALYCWGENVMGQLGDSTTVARAVPVLVKGGLTWSAVSAGFWRTCALTTTGAAYCWGSTGFGGALGTGTSTELVPAPVLGGHVFTAITTGGNQTCALDGANAAWCWGVNLFGQVGNGASGAAVTSPALVAGGLTFASISAGTYDYSDEGINGGTAAHTCAVTLAGVTYCWGVNNIGQLGNGTTGFAAVSAPSKVVGQP